MKPAWGCNYTTNINTEMNYWPAELTNLKETHEPLLQMVKELSENGREAAREMYGCRGWVLHHNTDLWRMKKVYLACVRAVDYLCSLPEWDGKNVIAQGGSQGGALSLIVTALDPRITLCVANHPALADMAAYAEKGRTGGYPHFVRKYQGIELTPEVIKTLSYYDVVNFARCIKVPVFMT